MINYDRYDCEGFPHAISWRLQFSFDGLAVQSQLHPPTGSKLRFSYLDITLV